VVVGLVLAVSGKIKIRSIDLIENSFGKAKDMKK